MIRFVKDVYEIVRPFGHKRLAVMCALLLASVLAQMAALFSVLPFLNAAADPEGFRASRMGGVFLAIIGDRSPEQVLLILGLFSLTLLIVGNLVMVGVDYARGRYAFHVGHRIRVLLIQQILARRYEFFLSQNSTALIKNLHEDVAIFCQAILVPLLDIFARSMLALLLIVSMLVLEPFVSLIGAVVIGLYVVTVILPVRRSASRTSEKIKHAIRGQYFEIGQTLSGAKPILANDAQAYFLRRCADASLTLSRLMPYSTLYPSIPRAGLEVLVFGGLISWVLVAMAAGGDLMSLMPRVGLIALLAYRLMPSLQLVLGQAMAISVMRQSMDEVLRRLREQEEFALESPRARLPGPAAEPLPWSRELAFDKVAFTYMGADRPALKEVSFSIAKGEHVAFVGPTGSGKSTLIDLILGLLPPTGGRIMVDGTPLDQEGRRHWRAVVGYVPQELFLLDATIAENIAFGESRDELDMDRVKLAADQAQAREFIDRQEKAGFLAEVGERGVRLSGGQRQRLALARALYREPSVLVLDEATSALDPETEGKVVSAIMGAADDMTLITVAHRLSTVEKCDRIFFLQDGRITAAGPFAELLENNVEFRRFAAQTRLEDDAAPAAPDPQKEPVD